jgi:hypothetical protein
VRLRTVHVLLLALVPLLALLARDADTPGRPLERRATGVAAGAACPRAEPPVPGPGRQLLGTHAVLRWAGAEDGRRLARLACATGARLSREDLDWSRVQPRRGGRMAWAPFDVMFLTAARSGLAILPILDGTPRWAGPDPEAPPRRPADLARFVRAAVRRYGPNGTLWRAHPDLATLAPRFFELYNEPYWSGVAPGDYARAVRTMTRAGRAADPQARFLLAAETENGAGRPWLAAMYRAVPDLGRWFDAVAVHPYSVGYDPGTYDPRSALRGRMTGRIVEVRDELARHGDGAKRLWITEVGWPTCAAAVGERCVSERTQERRVRDVLQLARTRWGGFVDAVVLFGMTDARRPEGSEGRYGLLRHDGTPKPAWWVLAGRP